MSTIEEALAVPAKPDLGDFEGLPVRQVGVEIPGAAGGLREPLKIKPQIFHKGERVTLTLDCIVDRIHFDSVDKKDPQGDQRRVHVLVVEEAAIIDRAIVADALAKQRRQITLAKEQAQGVARLPNDAEALLDAHENGKHANPPAGTGLVEGCPGCDEEVAAEAAERGEGQ